MIEIPRKKKKAHPLVGKIGWCDGSVLGLSQGHFVFIRRVYGEKCSVNTFTSIKDKNGRYKFSKLGKVESGMIYPISKNDVNLPRFSGIHKNAITNVPLSSVHVRNQYSLKRRHHHYIQKYMK